MDMVTLHFSVIEHASMHLCLLYMLALPGTDCEDWSSYTFTHSNIERWKPAQFATRFP